MINLELSPSLLKVEAAAKEIALNKLRPIARKYDKAEHSIPEELEEFRNMVANRTGGGHEVAPNGIRNGGNLKRIIHTITLCWGDVALASAFPGKGIGNTALNAAGRPDQKEKYGKKWLAFGLTEPGCGSDSKSIQTTARRDGGEWVLNGEKIFITGGMRCDAIVVWATTDKSRGPSAIRSFIVEKGTPGLELVRLEPKMGFRASDTAAFILSDCRIPGENILGSQDTSPKKPIPKKQSPAPAKTASKNTKGFKGAMKTFDNSRPMVAAIALGAARAALDVTNEVLARENIHKQYGKAIKNVGAIESELYRMEADYEAARLLSLKASWMADNEMPNTMEAAACKAKAGRAGNAIALKCVELCGSVGYSEEHLLEKIARDSKVIDIFEGTQQIQQLIVARNVLGKSSKELK